MEPPVVLIIHMMLMLFFFRMAWRTDRPIRHFIGTLGVGFTALHTLMYLFQY